MIFLSVTLTGCANETKVSETKETLLSWEQKTILVKIPPGKNQAEGWFVFTNQSNVPVKILAVESDCDCVITSTDLKLYYPDESGVLIATVELQSKESQVRKTINITTKAGTDEAVTTPLHLVANRNSVKTTK